MLRVHIGANTASWNTLVAITIFFNLKFFIFLYFVVYVQGMQKLSPNFFGLCWLAICHMLDTTLKVRSHEQLNHRDSVAEGRPAKQSLVWTYRCQLQWLSCGVAASSDSLWTCSKFGNQSLVAATGSLVWASSCWNLQVFIVLPPPLTERWTQSFPIYSSWVLEHTVASGSDASNSCQSASDRITEIQSLVWMDF